MYHFYLDSLELPVAPAKVEMKIANKNKAISLLGIGEVNQLKDAGLTEVNFEVLLPGRPYPFATYKDGFLPPRYYLSYIERLKVNKKPFQLIISRISPNQELLFDTSMKVSLEDYTIVEDAAEGFDIKVKLKLKQYKDYQTIELKLLEDEEGKGDTDVSLTQEKKRPTPATDQSYVVQSGDTLWGICRRKLGDGTQYKDVAKLNNIENPNLIYAGQVIRFE